MTKRLRSVGVDEALRLVPPLLEHGMYDEAHRWSQELVRRRVRDPRAWNFLGRSFERLGRERQAYRCFQMALFLAPGSYEIIANLAKIQRIIGKIEKSINFYKKALVCCENRSEILLGIGICHLIRGEFEAGFSLYEYRAGRLDVLEKASRHGLNYWDGGSLTGKRFLCIGEQGAGDVIMFARYVRILADRGAEVIVACHKPLQRLLQGLDGVSRVIGEKLTVRADMYDLIMSLPNRLGTRIDTIPAPSRYIEPPVTVRTLGRSKGLRVGLCWAGNPKQSLDRKRSMAFEFLRPVLDVQGIEFYSFQFGEQKTIASNEDRLIDLTNEISDYADTAGFLDQMDLVISVDTSVAHLSGALGLPTWVLLSVPVDWRYSLDDETTPWYPAHRLYRQIHAYEWDPVIRRVCNDLSQYVANSAAHSLAPSSNTE